jgi:hypothetical protein
MADSGDELYNVAITTAYWEIYVAWVLFMFLNFYLL